MSRATAIAPVLAPLLALAAGLLAVGCVSIPEELADHPCPDGGTTLTWENFGHDFMRSYCVHCHGGPNGYSSRALNTVEAVRVQRDRIFINSALDNTAMPPGPDDPPRDERVKLAEWLACGAP